MYYEKLNPFSFLVENSRYTLSRIFRSSYTQRFKDSFHVINGRLLKESGVADYLLLQLPNLLAHATKTLAETFSSVTGIGSKESSFMRMLAPRIAKIIAGIVIGAATLLLGGLAAMLVAAKTVLAATLTLASQLFVAATHLLTAPARFLAQDKINQLSVIPAPKGPNGKLLKAGERFFYDTINTNNQTDKENRMQSFKIFMQRHQRTPAEDLSMKPFMVKDKMVLGFYTSKNEKAPPAAIIHASPENKAGISALIKLNHFKVTENFATDRKLDALENQVGLRV